MNAPFRYSIRDFRTVSSTNLLLREYAREGAPEGLVITADYQTHGRGKPGTKWISPPKKNLLFSVLIRPPIPPGRAPLLTQIACRTAAAVLKRKYKIHSSFKRPNDVLVQQKKICGVLVETLSGTHGNLEWAVIGVGLNVNSSPKELVPGATSMKAVKRRLFNRKKLLRQLLLQLKKDLKGLYGYSA